MDVRGGGGARQKSLGSRIVFFVPSHTSSYPIKIDLVHDTHKNRYSK